MKLSNGTVLEFIFGIFFIFVGLNCTNIIAMLICIVGGCLASGHCVYCWIKKKKGKTDNQKEDD